jgi:hypothetical protein
VWIYEQINLTLINKARTSKNSKMMEMENEWRKGIKEKKEIRFHPTMLFEILQTFIRDK